MTKRFVSPCLRSCSNSCPVCPVLPLPCAASSSLPPTTHSIFGFPPGFVFPLFSYGTPAVILFCCCCPFSLHLFPAFAEQEASTSLTCFSCATILVYILSPVTFHQLCGICQKVGNGITSRSQYSLHLPYRSFQIRPPQNLIWRVGQLCCGSFLVI